MAKRVECISFLGVELEHRKSEGRGLLVLYTQTHTGAHTCMPIIYSTVSPIWLNKQLLEGNVPWILSYFCVAQTLWLNSEHALQVRKRKLLWIRFKDLFHLEQFASVLRVIKPRNNFPLSSRNICLWSRVGLSSALRESPYSTLESSVSLFKGYSTWHQNLFFHSSSPVLQNTFTCR